MSTSFGNQETFSEKSVPRLEKILDDEKNSSSELEETLSPQLNVENRKRKRSELIVSRSVAESSVAKKPNTEDGNRQNGNDELAISPPPQLERQDVTPIGEIAEIFNDEGFEEPVYPDLSRLFETQIIPEIPTILNHDPEVSAFIPYRLYDKKNKTERGFFDEEKDESCEPVIDLQVDKSPPVLIF